MKLYPSDIVLRIHLHGHGDGSINSKMLLQSLDTLETSLYASDRMDINLAFEELNIPSITRDACLERLRHHKHDRLFLEATSPGSLVIIGVVAAVSYFVLEKTLGESFKAAYLESESHERLKEFFKRIMDRKLLFLSENIRRTFSNKKKNINVTTEMSNGTEPNMIIVDIYGKPISSTTGQVRTLGQEIEK